MAMQFSWAFLLSVFAALCFMVLLLGAMVMVFRAAQRETRREPTEHADDGRSSADLTGNAGGAPPIPPPGADRR